MPRTALPEEYRALIIGGKGDYSISGIPARLDHPLTFPSRDKAETWLAENLSKVVAAGVKQRFCLCCHKPFLSLGAGNRMCQPCRRLPDSDGMPVSFSFRRRSAAHV